MGSRRFYFRKSTLMKTIVPILTAVLFVPLAATATECGIDPDRLGIRYTVTQDIEDETSHEQRKQHIQVWRHGNQAAYVHEEQQVTEIWDLVVDGRQKLIRYFDEYERAIEYQPGEINSSSGDEAWSRRYQLVSDDEMSAMTLTSKSGEGCDEVVHFEKIDADTGAHVSVVWQPAANVVTRLESKRGIETVTWALEELITDVDRVDDEFVRRNRYHTVDYVDIGDNESDPFLRRMMNLGHIDSHHTH